MIGSCSPWPESGIGAADTGPADTGAADPAVAAALAGYAAGRTGEAEVLRALAAARLLVPVVVLPAAGGPSGETAFPLVVGRDGRRAMAAFTAADALRRWRPDARPMPVAAGALWSSVAEEDAAAVVVDIAGPVPFVVEGARLAALARGEPPPEPYQDPDVHALVEAAVRTGAGEPGTTVTAVRLGPGQDTDLRVHLIVTANAADPVTRLARRVAELLAERLGGRLRRGIDVAVERATVDPLIS